MDWLALTLRRCFPLLPGKTAQMGGGEYVDLGAIRISQAQ